MGRAFQEKESQAPLQSVKPKTSGRYESCSREAVQQAKRRARAGRGQELGCGHKGV